MTKELEEFIDCMLNEIDKMALEVLRTNTDIYKFQQEMIKHAAKYRISRYDEM